MTKNKPAVKRSSLWREYPWHFDIPALTVVSVIALYFGLTRPIVRISAVLNGAQPYSVLSGIREFWNTGDYFIAALIFIFSAAFPIIKLSVLLWLWFMPTVAAHRRWYLKVIEPLGKWSMLDVLVVILFAGAIQLGFIADARVLPGVYIYAGAILLSMIAAVRMANLAGPQPGLRLKPRRRAWLMPPLVLIGLVLLLGGLLAPLMAVEKWYFWSEEFSIVMAVVKLARQGEPLLALGFLLFVILLPLLVYLGQLALSLYQLSGRGGGRGLAWLVEFERWAMTDVFALALFVALFRFRNWLDVQPKVGIYLFGAAVLVSFTITIWLRWIYRR